MPKRNAVKRQETTVTVVHVEILERRQLLSTTSTVVASPLSIVATTATTVSPHAGTTTSAFGYTPAQIRKAYGFDAFTLSSGLVADGAGQTIAIVDAYDDPNIASDLHVFSTTFGLSDPPSFKKVTQTGGSTASLQVDSGWAGEISLDVEWAHAIAPKANILLVEAKSANLNDLLTAVNYARKASGVSVVSLSWGSGEFSNETSYDSYFTTPAGHQGVTFVASAGDDGAFYGPSWPSTSTNVLGVGGTTLDITSAGNYLGETGWTYGGGGLSSYTGSAAYQKAVTGSTRRSAPDVSYDADPDTGFAVYDSVPDQGYSGWMQIGGTSAGAPQWAALVALANQARVANGAGTLDGAAATIPTLYGLYTNASYTASFNDVTYGQNSYSSYARAGYDRVSGLGTPKAAAVLTALSGAVKASSSSLAKSSTLPSNNFGRHRLSPFTASRIVPPATADASSSATAIRAIDATTFTSTGRFTASHSISAFDTKIDALSLSSTGSINASDQVAKLSGEPTLLASETFATFAGFAPSAKVEDTTTSTVAPTFSAIESSTTAVSITGARHIAERLAIGLRTAETIATRDAGARWRSPAVFATVAALALGVFAKRESARSRELARVRKRVV